MELEPSADYAQVQSLTTTLKNICRDYPAGGTVLRELLQNADDAGATERFILDGKTYPTEEIIDPKLAKFQGPAILAYNNAIFTDKDFTSLSRLGDSLKIDDGLTTGKFGRGFNSVYNWTDSPSIVSRESLLILDPHHEWSPGGNAYNFVKNSANAKIKNHMAAFQAITSPLDQRLDGTIIRIPLRTKAQVKDSKIADYETTVSDIVEVFEKFATEFGDHGLLFLRNIQKIELKSPELSLLIKMEDDGNLGSHKLKINNAVKCALSDPSYSFDYSFGAGIEYNSNGISKKFKFIIHHSIRCDLMESGLRNWAKGQKFIPWIAVAAQIPINSGEVKGSLFTVLPLPIESNQPVHIHGLFSLSPDRARLHQHSDRSAQDQNPARWNSWLLKESLPIAWTKLLKFSASIYPQDPAFERWPKSISNDRDPLSYATTRVMEIIEKESLALWPTTVGYVTAQNGLLATEPNSTNLRDALQEARVPVVYVPSWLQCQALELFKERILCPQSLCLFLKTRSSQIKSWSDRAKHQILEYVLSKPGFIDYDGLELFPFKDGMYRSIGDIIAFVHRDKLEETLFNLEDSRNLDLEKLSKATQQALQKGCKSSTIHPSIRYRSASSLKEYCMTNVFQTIPENQDMVFLSKECVKIVSKIWNWISVRGIHVLDKDIAGLWLIPLSNDQHRKLMPQNLSSQVYLTPKEEIGELMWKFNTNSSAEPLLLSVEGPTGLSSKPLSILTENPDYLSKLCIKDAKDMVYFLEWCDLTSALIDDASDEVKQQITSLVVSHLPKKLSSSQEKIVVQALSRLKIFHRVSWKAKNGKMETILTWTNLISCSTSIGLLDDIVPVPEIDGFQFLIANPTRPEGQLLQNYGLVNCVRWTEVIKDYILPRWKPEQLSKWEPSCKEKVAEFILHRFSLLPDGVRVTLRALPIVPVATLNGIETSSFVLAESLINPDIAELKDLCFDDEEIIPNKRFFPKFKMELKECGLKTAVDETVVEHRVRCYASGNYPPLDTQKRCRKLLQSHVRWGLKSQSQDTSILQRLPWLPVTDLDGNSSLQTSAKCRGLREKLLVSSQLPILKFHIAPEWEARLGWLTTIPNEILLSQLGYGIENMDPTIVDAVLDYVCEKKLTEQLVNKLINIPCVLTSNRCFVLPSQAVCPAGSTFNSCERLQPYVWNVEQKFWEDHKSLLEKLNIGELYLSNLLQIQVELERKPTPLEEDDILVAIEILNLASRIQSDSLKDVKVIGDDRKLHPVHDINYNDLGLTGMKQKINRTHPHISEKVIKKLNIGSLSEQLIKGLLEIEDIDDDDEFDQRERVTTRITDTLNRYPVETTFREYLANADDAARATEINWCLDERDHPGNALLTPQLQKLQGPAVLVHNNSVFSEDDFKGFKNVGEGSKTRNEGSIGQFGRGSQTMYHWTDVPMILSGKWLLILDPQQKVLPFNRIKGKRKPGVKLLLSKLRDACPDQLIPFEGLWNFTHSCVDYPGTIFRFALRTSTSRSNLETSEKKLSSKEVKKYMNAYFDEARISLLFLRKIKRINFCIYGKPEFDWSVTRRPPLDEDAKLFSEIVICDFSKNMNSTIPVTGKDKWLVAIEDLRPEAGRLPKSSRRIMKNVECGIAGLLSSKVESDDINNMPTEVIQSKLFNTLPLPFASDLPVHIHATFMLSGDRQSIAIDANGMQFNESKWNIYLLEEALPKLYLEFLEDIITEDRKDSFRFWPQREPPERSCAEIIYASFWKELPKSSQRVFPKAQLATGGSKRQAAKRFDISQAIFDFLPINESSILASLLVSLEPHLVRGVPFGIKKHLKESDAKSLTTPLLRKLFKSNESRELLLDEMTKDSATLQALFRQLVPPSKPNESGNDSSDNLDDLDGCQIIPLATGGLAQLKLIDSCDTDSPKLYVAAGEELRIFEFASLFLVPLATVSDLRTVFESGKFNLTRLHISHVEELLKMKPAATSPDSQGDIWLAEFWEYWNKYTDSSLPSFGIDTFSAGIFRATRDGTEIYASPLAFHKQFAAVVEPCVSDHQELCNKFPGLYRFTAKFLPKPLADKEKSFEDKDSFCRFIRALRRLANSSGIGIERFCNIYLDPPSLKILRNLVKSHASKKIEGQESEQSLEFRSDLKSLPLWPSLYSSSPGQMLSANDVLMAENHELLVPWMKNGYRFVSTTSTSDRFNMNCLLKLGTQKLSTEVLLKSHILPLPSTLNDNEWEKFRSVVSFLSGLALGDSLKSFLAQSKIAADGHRHLSKASELYDHEDSIFQSAFRQKKMSYFLHDDLKTYRWLWLKVGLRQNENRIIKASYYISCLQELGLRLSAGDSTNDPHLLNDSQIVLSPLTAANPSVYIFSASEWQTISVQRVFQAKTTFNSEFEYRRATMASVAANQPILRLCDIVSYDLAAVCWSQTSFAVHDPTREVLLKIYSKGLPEIGMVLRHLQHLHNVAQSLTRDQIRNFLIDLHLTYDYLQDHLAEIKDAFNVNFRKSTIWLNLNTSSYETVLLDDIQSSWHGIEELVLSSSCDAGSIKAVRPGLMRYEKLLIALGCSSIIYPTVTRPTLHHSTSVSSSLRKLRDKEQLIDVTYHTEGKYIKAHRVVLAAMSEKCATHFSGKWTIEDVIKFDKNEDAEGFLSYHTLSTMVMFAYGDEINWKEMEVADGDDAEQISVKLDLLLDLLRGADYWLIPALMSEVEDKILVAGKAFINLDNVKEVHEHASCVGAKAVAQMCAEFIKQNQAAVNKAHSRL